MGNSCYHLILIRKYLILTVEKTLKEKKNVTIDESNSKILDEMESDILNYLYICHCWKNIFPFGETEK